MDNRRMCPSCRAFISSSDRVCPYCEAQIGQKAIERRAPSDVIGIPSARFTTTVILLINFGLYAATALYSMRISGNDALFDIDGRTLLLFGAKYPPAIAEGQWWRLLTAGFLHGGILHLAMNCWVIFDLGTQVEELYGTSRYLVLYFLTTIAGFMASSWWSSSLSIGASAPLFGLIGAMIALGVKHRHTSLGAAMRGHYTQWAVWGLAMGLLPGFRVDNAAHIGGLASGFALGYLIGTPKLFEDWTTKAWKAAAGICLALTLVSFGLMFLFLTSV